MYLLLFQDHGDIDNFLALSQNDYISFVIMTEYLLFSTKNKVWLNCIALKVKYMASHMMTKHFIILFQPLPG